MWRRVARPRRGRELDVWWGRVAAPPRGAAWIFRGRAQVAAEVGSRDALNAEALALLCWAFARQRRDAPTVFEAGALLDPAALSPDGVARCAWAFSAARTRADGLYGRLGLEVVRRANDFDAKQLTTVAYAFARRRAPAPPGLLDAIADALDVDALDAQGLSNTAWAFATLKRRDAALFAAVARASSRKLDDFAPQNLANVAWSFASRAGRYPKRGRGDAALFTRATDDPRRGRGAGHSSGRPAVSLLRARRMIRVVTPARVFFRLGWLPHRSLGVRAPRFFDDVGAVASRKLASFEPRHLSSVAWSFAKAGRRVGIKRGCEAT